MAKRTYTTLTGAIIALLLYISVLGFIGYIAIHFIRKFW